MEKQLHMESNQSAIVQAVASVETYTEEEAATLDEAATELLDDEELKQDESSLAATVIW